MELRMVDTHCHLEQGEFDIDRDDAVERARSRCIAAISSGITPDTWEKNLDICRKYDVVFPALGLYPTEYQQIMKLLPLLRQHRENLVAIGETGLDFYLERDHTARQRQEESFVALIRIAEEFGLPLQVHSRSAGRAAIMILEKAEADSVHMHAFDARASIARMASCDLGYYFSIPTSVVRSPQKQKLVRAVNIEHLLVETDSPVLGADREARNEPANLPIAVRTIASILHRNEEEVREILLENTLRLYSRIKAKWDNS